MPVNATAIIFRVPIPLMTSAGKGLLAIITTSDPSALLSCSLASEALFSKWANSCPATLMFAASRSIVSTGTPKGSIREIFISTPNVILR